MSEINEMVAQAEALGFVAKYDAEQRMLIAEYTASDGRRWGVGVTYPTMREQLYGGDWWGHELRTKLAEIGDA